MARSQTREKDFAGWLFEASPETGCSGGAWVEAAFCSFCCYCDPGDPGTRSDLASAALGTLHPAACAAGEVAVSCSDPDVEGTCSHTPALLYPRGRQQDPVVDDWWLCGAGLAEHGLAPVVGGQLLGFPLLPE